MFGILRRDTGYERNFADGSYHGKLTILRQLPDMMLRVLPAGCSVEEMVHIRETHMQVESVMHLPGMGAAFHCLRFYIPMIVSMTANIAGTVAAMM